MVSGQGRDLRDLKLRWRNGEDGDWDWDWDILFYLGEVAGSDLLLCVSI